MTVHHYQTLHQQRGVTTILISVIMLFLVTLVVLTTSKTVLMEQKIASNMVRSEQSLEAAETGLQEALNYLSSITDWTTITALSAGDAFNIFDTDANGTVDSNTGTQADGSSYTLVLGAGSDLTADPLVIEIQSTGVSDDGVATRVVNRLIKFIDPVPFPLDNPILSGGGATISGSADVWNPEGHSTIWSGGSVNTGSNTHIANPDDGSYPDCMETPMTCSLIASSTSTLTGLDVVEQDSSLAALSDDDFFKNFFGMSKSEYKNMMVSLEVSAGNITNEWDAASPGVDHAQNEIIWVDATSGDAMLNGNHVSGCETNSTANDAYGNATCLAAERKPSILIIDGNLKLVGNFDHYGIVFVTGKIFGAGTARIEGSLVVGGEADTTGTLDVWFNSDMVKGAGQGNNWGGSDGGWRDFN
jgi:hypothetical protein